MSTTTAPPTPTSEWEAVFQSLPTPDEGWATAKAVAEVVHLSPSTVTRRLNALEEGGRVESCSDKAVTGARGKVWRQRAGARLRLVGGIETINLPVEDVEPDPVAAGDVDSVGRACSKCGEPINPIEAEAGYTRCEVCDPDGEHSVHGPAPEMTDATLVGVGVAIGLAGGLPATGMSDDEANEEFDGLPASMIDDDALQLADQAERDRDVDVTPGAFAVDGEDRNPAETAPALPVVVLIASPIEGQPPQRAELYDDGSGSTVKVIYCDSRTGARVARSRILDAMGVADYTQPLTEFERRAGVIDPAVPVDDEDGDPSPVSPAPTGGDYTAIAEALAPAGDPLTAQDARALTDRIRVQVSDLLPLIKEAYNRRAHVSLGYVTWAEYCDTELRGLRMPLAERQAATAELRAEGMSTRAIAGALGSSDATVRRDLAAAGATDEVPERSTGLDGRSYPARKPKTAADGAHIPPSADGAEGVVIPPDDAPATGDDGGAASPVVPGGNPSDPARLARSRRAHESLEQRDDGPLVWIATARESVTYHLPADDDLTACKRSMRTGDLVAIGVVEWRHSGTACERCWPEPTATTDSPAGPAAAPTTPGDDGGDSRLQDRPGADYEPDPAARIAAVAEVAPEYVQPVDEALVGEVLPAPDRQPTPDPEYIAAVANRIRLLGVAIDELEQLTWDDGPGGPLTLPDLKHERRRIDKLIGHLQKSAA